MTKCFGTAEQNMFTAYEKNLWHHVLWFQQLHADKINTVSSQDTQILLLLRQGLYLYGILRHDKTARGGSTLVLFYIVLLQPTEAH